MRLLVYGHRGLLGASIVGYAPRHGHVAYTAALEAPVREQIEKYMPDVIINCAGTDNRFVNMIYLNALFPHHLAGATSLPILHMSTARVFSGTSLYRYRVNDIPDACDMFGRTKAIGEVFAPHVTNVRSAFIGRGKGFVEDVVKRNSSFRGLVNYRWTGSTVDAVAHRVLELVKYAKDSNIVHLATRDSISLDDAARLVAEHYGIENNIQQALTPVKNYALIPSIVIPSLEEAIKDWVTQDQLASPVG
jgi:dTDP-4-dehydrorhamnose reductase